MTTKRPMLVLPPALAPLAKESRWVVWKWVKGKTGKWTKPPYQGCAPGRYAKSDDPSTWCDVNTAMLCYTEGHCDGLGFVLGDDAPLGALDLDDCRNKETSELHPWARAKIALAQSYVEVTPSGEGVRAERQVCDRLFAGEQRRGLPSARGLGATEVVPTAGRDHL